MSLRLTLPVAPRSVPIARHAVANLDGLPAGRERDLQLIVSELVTNAIRHAGKGPKDQIRLEARYREGSVRVAVHDGGPGFDPYTAPRRHNGGHGLILVDRLADDWGVEPGGVWATLTWT